MLTLGRNTKQSVKVVQKIVKTAVIANVAFWCSRITEVMATPSTDSITTLYTDMPERDVKLLIRLNMGDLFIFQPAI